MLDNIFRSVFATDATVVNVSVFSFLFCIIVSVVIGILLALCYTYKNNYTKSFLVTLAIIPPVVCMIIMMVNGNIGAGVAVAGAFSLIRFRSVPGTAKEIGAIFIAMATGLATGMGYIAYAIIFSIILSVITVVYNKLSTDSVRFRNTGRAIRITVPEDLDYTGIFDDLFDKYTTSTEMVEVKTTNMGSLFKLTYNVILKDERAEKEFIDALRCRNGNLEISISKQATVAGEL